MNELRLRGDYQYLFAGLVMGHKTKGGGGGGGVGQSFKVVM